MGPYDEADDADRDERVDHPEVPEDRFAAERRHDLADDPEVGQNHDVDFRVSEEPEQVLKQNRISAALGGKKRRLEIAIREKHGNGAGKHRQGQQKQKRGDQYGPHEQRRLMQSHARCAHVEDRRDEIDGSQDGRCAGDVN